jgi:glycosyltransferase involved in cell wall biosynthesis
VRIAVDEQIFLLQPYGGISRLFSELMRELTALGEEHNLSLDPLNTQVINRYLLDDPELTGKLGVTQAASEWHALARYVKNSRKTSDADIVHNTFYLPWGLAPKQGARRVATIHDLIPERMPETRRRLDFLTKKKDYLRKADHIICVSEATKSDLLEIYGEQSVPVSVIHLGVDPKYVPQAPVPTWLPRDYVLMVGHRGQYKDAQTLFRAFARIAPEDPDLHLVCLGGGAFNRAEKRMLQELGIAERVAQHSIQEQDMPGVYGGSRAFVLPSQFEGFGLPVLEAMASGAPTILARATSLPEVGGDAARYFTPSSDVELAECLSSILLSPALAQDLRQRGIQRAAQFTWRKHALQTIAVYQSLVGGERP